MQEARVGGCLTTGWSVFRIVLGLAILTIGYLSLIDGERSTRHWRGGEARLRRVVQSNRGVVEAPADAVDHGNEGRLIHLTAPLSIAPPVDPVTGLSVPALAIRRIVEMYQWSRHLMAASRQTYTYRRGWSEALIDSDSFGPLFGGQDYRNPKSIPYRSRVTFAAGGPGRLGPYRLQDGYLETLDEDWVPLPEALVAAARLAGGWTTDGESIYVMPEGQPLRVGAVRVHYDYQPLDPRGYSVLGIQRGDTISFEGVMGEQAAAVIEPGRVSVDGLLRGFGALTSSAATWERVSAAAWIAVGLMLSLRPWLLLLGRAPGFTNGPALRRLWVTSGISVLAAVIVVVATVALTSLAAAPAGAH